MIFLFVQCGMNFKEENPYSVSSVGAAVRMNDVSAVRKAIRKGLSIDVKDNRGWSALHCAANENYLEIIPLLLKAGADVNSRTHEGETSLSLACGKNHLHSVSILLAAGASVNLPNNEDVTPLHIVAAAGFDELATVLLDFGADVNAVDYDNDTPLIEAARNEHDNMCKILLSYEANQTKDNATNSLPIHFACLRGNVGVLKTLLNHRKDDKKYLNTIVNWINIYGYTPLMLAVQASCFELVSELLRSGADANIGACNDTGIITLHLAAQSGNLPVLEVILEATTEETVIKYCCDLNTNHEIGIAGPRNLICHAIESKSEECLAYLLNYGFGYAVLNSLHNWMTPLDFIFCCKFDSSFIRRLEILLQSGFDINFSLFRTDHFHFLLEPSFQSDSVEAIVRILVDHGLMLDYKSYKPTIEGELVLPDIFFYACVGGHFKLVPYLLQITNIVEPSQVLIFVLRSFGAKKEWTTKHDLSAFLNFLVRYVKAPYPTCEVQHGSYSQFFRILTQLPTLKSMSRSVIREYIHSVCASHEHQFKVKLNSLYLPQSLQSYVNYDEMPTFYESLRNNPVIS